MFSSAADRYQSDAELCWEAWQRKPCLRAYYLELFHTIKKHLLPGPPGTTIEIGSGMCVIKDVIPECVCTDILENERIDRYEDIYALSNECSDARNIILFDVLHHLQFPGDALAQLHNALGDRGRVILVEPYISVGSWIAYGVFHHERLALFSPITWHADIARNTQSRQYYADQATATKLYTCKKYRSLLEEQWNIVSVERQAAYRYLGSGGFRNRQLYPSFLYGVLKAVDRVLSLVPWLFGARIIMVLEKK